MKNNQIKNHTGEKIRSMQWPIIENCEKKRKLSSVIKSPGKFQFLQTLIFFLRSDCFTKIIQAIIHFWNSGTDQKYKLFSL